MPRFFVPSENILAEDGRPYQVRITGADVNHIRNVLRLSAGDVFSVCDSRGTQYMCVLKTCKKDEVTADIEEACESDSEPKVPVVLYQGVPKGDKMELIIQKCVELGANEFVPVITERTVVKLPTKEDREKKCIRWQRISLEASKQCGRGIIPSVETPITMVEALSRLEERYPDYLYLLPYENETSVTLRQALGENFGENNANPPKGIVLFIGPEGGFSHEEVELAATKGFKSVTLGKRILRTETAGLAAVAAIRYEIGD